MKQLELPIKLDVETVEMIERRELISIYITFKYDSDSEIHCC